MTFLHTLLSGNENSERESNPFLANSASLNKQSFILKLEFKKLSPWKKFILFGEIKIAFFLYEAASFKY